MIKFHKRTHYEGHIKAKNKSIYSPSQRANRSTGTLRQLEMKLQTLNILHSISCLLFYAWSGEKRQSKPVVLRRSQKFYTASRSPSSPWPLRLDIDQSRFSGGRNLLPKHYSGPEKLEGFLFLFFFLRSLMVWKKSIHSLNTSSVSVYPGQCCGRSRSYTKSTGACWEYTLDGMSVHRREPCTIHTQGCKNDSNDEQLKKGLIVRFQSWARCILPARGAAERSRD